MLVTQHRIIYPHFNINDTTNHFNEIIISYDGFVKEKYQRTYKKLQNLFAEIGGVIKLLTLIGLLMCIPIS
jgi:hypothetical protein